MSIWSNGIITQFGINLEFFILGAISLDMNWHTSIQPSLFGYKISSFERIINKNLFISFQNMVYDQILKCKNPVTDTYVNFTRN